MSKKLLFIWIPKCAGSSIFSQFKLKSYGLISDVYDFDNNSNVTFGHADINAVIEKNFITLDFYKSSFKFCIVRNPYDRAVSLFFFLELNKKYSFESWVDYLYENKEYIPRNSHTNVSYYEFINDRWNLVGPGNAKGIDCISNQWNPMSSWVPDDINKIYYFEELDGIVADLHKILGTKGETDDELVHKNKSSHRDYREYYNTNTRNKIYELYKEDFIRFNYSIDL